MRHAICAMLFQFRFPPSVFPLPHSHFPLPTSHFRIPTSHFPLPHSHFRIPTSDFPLPHSHFRIPPSAFPLPTSFICRPTADPRQTWLLPSRYPPRACFHCPGSVGERPVIVQFFLLTVGGLKTSPSSACRTKD